MQIYGSKKDNDTRKLIRFCQERKVVFHFKDLDQETLKAGEWENLARAAGSYDVLLDAGSAEFEKLGLAHSVYESREVLIEHPRLLKVPLLREGNKILLGYDEKKVKDFLASLL